MAADDEDHHRAGRRSRRRPHRPAAAARAPRRLGGRRRGRRCRGRDADGPRRTSPTCWCSTSTCRASSASPRYPACSTTPETAIVVLTMQDDPAFARARCSAGRAGYVLKEAADAELVGGRARAPPLAAPTSTRGSAPGWPPRRGAGGPAGRPHRARGRGPAADRARPHQRRDRRQLFLTCAPSSPTARTSSRSCAAPRAPSSSATRSTTGCHRATEPRPERGTRARRRTVPARAPRRWPPPASAARSRMPARPKPSLGSAESKPRRRRSTRTSTASVAAARRRSPTAASRACLTDVRQRLLDDPIDRGLELGASASSPASNSTSSLTSTPSTVPRAARERLERRPPARAGPAPPGRSSVIRARSSPISPVELLGRLRDGCTQRPRFAARVAPAASSTPSAAEPLQGLVVQLARPAAALGSAERERCGEAARPRPTWRSRPRSPRCAANACTAPRRRSPNSGSRRRRSNAASTPRLARGTPSGTSRAVSAPDARAVRPRPQPLASVGDALGRGRCAAPGRRPTAHGSARRACRPRAGRPRRR